MRLFLDVQRSQPLPSVCVLLATPLAAYPPPSRSLFSVVRRPQASLRLGAWKRGGRSCRTRCSASRSNPPSSALSSLVHANWLAACLSRRIVCVCVCVGVWVCVCVCMCVSASTTRGTLSAGGRCTQTANAVFEEEPKGSSSSRQQQLTAFVVCHPSPLL